jgi:hypothetical protein
MNRAKFEGKQMSAKGGGGCAFQKNPEKWYIYRSLAGFRTTFFWVASAPLSTLVHLDNPTCDKCSKNRPIIASRIIGR